METRAQPGAEMYGFLSCTANQFMTRTVVSVKRGTTIRELGELFEKHDFNVFPVVEDAQVLGIVSKFDFLRAFAFTSNQLIPHYHELMGRFEISVCQAWEGGEVRRWMLRWPDMEN